MTSYASADHPAPSSDDVKVAPGLEDGPVLPVLPPLWCSLGSDTDRDVEASCLASCAACLLALLRFLCVGESSSYDVARYRGPTSEYESYGVPGVGHVLTGFSTGAAADSDGTAEGSPPVSEPAPLDSSSSFTGALLLLPLLLSVDPPKMYVPKSFCEDDENGLLAAPNGFSWS